MAEQIDANGNPTAFIEQADRVAQRIEQGIQQDEEIVKSAVVREIEGRFQKAESARDSHERRWAEAFHNYRGIYGKHLSFRQTEKSKVFVKITKTKVLAAYGQLAEVVFGGNRFPISIHETKVPEGMPEYAHLNPMKDQTTSQPSPDIEGSPTGGEEAPPEGGDFNLGFEGDGKKLKPGANYSDVFENSEGNDEVLDEGRNIMGGEQIKPARIAARRMEKLIMDQIDESHGTQQLRKALFESSLLGTGIIKGPFNYNKTLHKWSSGEDGQREYTPEYVKVPRLEFVSLWNFYPDPEATSMSDLEWVIQRHKLSASEMRGLASRPFFRGEEIAKVISDGPNYTKKDFETEIESDDSSVTQHDASRFEVLEYWGVIGKEALEGSGLSISNDDDKFGQVNINAWICNGTIIRLVLNPFQPVRIPYLVFPYELNPYSIFGVGVAENMNDSQQIMNGHARMAIDNLALSGNVMLDVDESALVPGEDFELYAGKIFKRQGGMPGQSVYGITIPNTAPANLQMFDRFRQFADEETGIPSFSHGYTGVTGMTRTAAGMSMLMGAASLNVKTVVKNIDDFLLKPLGEGLFQWNMQNYKGDLQIVGDLEVKATGTQSLIQKEVRSQRLTQLLQVVANPALAPFVRLETLLKELAYSLELDPEDFILSKDEAAIHAKIIGMAGGIPQAQQTGMPGGNAGNGNATIGTGDVPQPGEESFTGTPQPDRIKT